jgi:PRC-barrel domain
VEYTTYASRLRFLAADAVTDDVVNYDGLEVRGPSEEKLGRVDGFIVDAEAGRVYYVVVDSGGWFSSRRFLLPIGHATIDPDRKVLHVAVSKDALSKYPEFDEDRFRQFSDEDLRAFEQRLASACCPDETPDDTGLPSWSYTSRRHYDQPVWWKAGGHLRERLRPVSMKS